MNGVNLRAVRIERLATLLTTCMPADVPAWLQFGAIGLIHGDTTRNRVLALIEPDILRTGRKRDEWTLTELTAADCPRGFCGLMIYHDPADYPGEPDYFAVVGREYAFNRHYGDPTQLPLD